MTGTLFVASAVVGSGVVGSGCTGIDDRVQGQTSGITVIEPAKPRIAQMALPPASPGLVSVVICPAFDVGDPAPSDFPPGLALTLSLSEKRPNGEVRTREVGTDDLAGLAGSTDCAPYELTYSPSEVLRGDDCSGYDPDSEDYAACETINGEPLPEEIDIIARLTQDGAPIDEAHVARHPSAGVDLVATFARVVEAAGGGTLGLESVLVRTCNRGGANSEASVTLWSTTRTIHRAQELDPNEGDLLLGGPYAREIGGGDCVYEEFSNVDATVWRREGEPDRRLMVAVDHEDSIVEAFEDNNTDARTMRFDVGLPDLVIAAATLPPRIAGQDAIATMKVCNNGRHASHHPARLTIDTTSDDDPANTRRVGESTFDVRYSGECETQLVALSFPHPGENALTMAIDPGDEVLESIEENNVFRAEVGVGTGADFEIAQYTVYPAEDGLYRAEFMVCNHGNEDFVGLGPLELHLWAHPESVDGQSSTLLANASLVRGSLVAQSLRAGECLPGWASLSRGAAFSGITEVVLQVDSAPDEVRLDNNTAEALVRFGGYADFSLTLIEPPYPQSPESQGFEPQGRVCNVGTLAGTAEIAFIVTHEPPVAPISEEEISRQGGFVVDRRVVFLGPDEDCQLIQGPMLALETPEYLSMAVLGTPSVDCWDWVGGGGGCSDDRIPGNNLSRAVRIFEPAPSGLLVRDLRVFVDHSHDTIPGGHAADVIVVESDVCNEGTEDVGAGGDAFPYEYAYEVLATPDRFDRVDPTDWEDRFDDHETHVVLARESTPLVRAGRCSTMISRIPADQIVGRWHSTYISALINEPDILDPADRNDNVRSVPLEP
ncbi:MAG: hypothetical protein IPK13_06030 [Deltaproteobacteria bacterium]|nr:hypothetical protein [Deltaproteobacteria bacterium]